MSWSYNETDLSETSASGRLNAVRFLIGDTDTNDQQVQDEEINFGLSQSNDNIYYAGAVVAEGLAAKFARKVNTEINGALKADYGELYQKFKALSTSLRARGQQTSVGTTALRAGGISLSAIDTARKLSDRPASAFSKDQFANPPAKGKYIQDDD